MTMTRKASVLMWLLCLPSVSRRTSRVIEAKAPSRVLHACCGSTITFHLTMAAALRSLRFAANTKAAVVTSMNALVAMITIVRVYCLSRVFHASPIVY